MNARGANVLTGRVCSSCGVPTRTGSLGGPDNDTEYWCDDCDVRWCWDCLVGGPAEAHERTHETADDPAPAV